MSNEGSTPVFAGALVRVTRFCDNNPLVIQAERYLETLVFDNDDVPWDVQWGDAADTATGPAWLASAPFRQSLRRILVRARQHVQRLGFCGTWALKGGRLVAWWRDYLEAPDEATRERLGLPFGVIEPTEALFWRQPRPNASLAAHLTVQPAEMAKEEAAGYVFSVFDHDSTLVPAPDDYYRATLAVVAAMPRIAAIRAATDVQGSAADGRSPVLQPRSPFYQIEERWGEIEEARANLRAADACVSQPLVLLSVPPVDLKHASLERATPGDLFEPGTIMDTLIHQAMQPQEYSLERARQLLDRHEAMVARTQGRAPGETAVALTPTEARRRYYGHPFIYERPYTLPDAARAAYVHVPNVLRDLSVLEDRFAAEVASVMNVSVDVLLRARQSVEPAATRAEHRLMGGTRTIESQGDRRQATTLRTERELYVRLFAHFYNSSLALIDMAALDTLIDALETRRHALVDAAASSSHDTDASPPDAAADEARAGRAALRQHVAVAAAAAAAADDVAERRRATLTQVRGLLHSLRARATTRGGLAALVFATTPTQQTSVKLAGLLELYDRGLVAPAALEPAAQMLFGDHVRLLKEVPPAPAPPAKRSGGAPSKDAAARGAKRSRRHYPEDPDE